MSTTPRATPKAQRRDRKRQNKQAASAARAAEIARRKRQRTTRRVGVIAVLGVAILIFLAVQSSGGKKKTDVKTTAAGYPAGCVSKKPAANPKRPTFTAEPPMTIDKSKTYTATFDTTCGKFVAVLDATNAPATTNSFVFLARQKFYDGLKFHRVVDNFVIQGGDPAGTGSGGPGYTLAEEPPPDGKYPPGSLAMAKTGAPHSTGSQFFVVTGNPAALESTKTYSYFGKVTKGLDVAKKIESMHEKKAGFDGPPKPDAYIFSVSITES